MFQAALGLGFLGISLAAVSKNATATIRRLESTTDALCAEMKSEYKVVPGSSWGSLPILLQKQWSRLHCDQLSSDFADGPEEVTESYVSIDLKATALPKVSSEFVDWCKETKSKYKVIPMKSWGTLPMNLIEVWNQRRCDIVFTALRMARRPVSQCIPLKTNEKAQKSSRKGGDLPLIAVMAASTTRKVSGASTSTLSLFQILLPSLIRSLDCGFRYEYVLGYDKGDPFYDSTEGMKAVTKWFEENVEKPLERNGIRIIFRPVKVNNTLKKPGPVFIAMARAAYSDAGASYFFRLNDDTELTANWAKKFTSALQSLGAPYGVVGPSCNTENMLTHDFVHRTHMEIFDMNYYPPQLSDWWMDDWISLVYGKSRSFKATQIPVIHHTGAHGRRYEVDRSHQRHLSSLVEEGRKKIRRWMSINNVPEHVITSFDTDTYQAEFIHNDIPAAD